MFLLRFLHRIAIHMAMIADFDQILLFVVFLSELAFSGPVHSLRIDSRVGAHSSISLMTISHLKLCKVRGLVFFRIKPCLSENRKQTSSRTNLPNLASFDMFQAFSCNSHLSTTGNQFAKLLSCW